MQSVSFTLDLSRAFLMQLRTIHFAWDLRLRSLTKMSGTCFRWPGSIIFLLTLALTSHERSRFGLVPKKCPWCFMVYPALAQCGFSHFNVDSDKSRAPCFIVFRIGFRKIKSKWKRRKIGFTIHLIGFVNSDRTYRTLLLFGSDDRKLLNMQVLKHAVISGVKLVRFRVFSLPYVRVMYPVPSVHFWRIRRLRWVGPMFESQVSMLECFNFRFVSCGIMRGMSQRVQVKRSKYSAKFASFWTSVQVCVKYFLCFVRTARCIFVKTLVMAAGGILSE